MQPIDSNYPREPEASRANVDLGSLHRVFLASLILSVANAICFVFAVLVLVQTTKNREVASMVVPSTFLYFVTGVALAGAFGVWCKKAYRALCALRNMSPAYSPRLIGLLAYFNVPFLGLPLAYIMEFLEIRSRNLNLPTMKIQSLWSKSGICNAYAAASVLGPSLTILSIVFLLGTSKWDFLVIPGMILVQLSPAATLAMMVRVNRQLAVLAAAEGRQ